MSDNAQDFDPPEPPEGGSGMRSEDLQNKVCIFQPMSSGEWPERTEKRDPETGEITQKAQGPRPYLECNVWVLDRAGVTETGTGVRVSWWKAVEQMKDRMGEFVAGKPVKQSDRSVVLLKLEGAARKVAGEVIADIRGGTEPAPVSDEPF